MTTNFFCIFMIHLRTASIGRDSSFQSVWAVSVLQTRSGYIFSRIFDGDTETLNLFRRDKQTQLIAVIFPKDMRQLMLFPTKVEVAIASLLIN